MAKKIGICGACFSEQSLLFWQLFERRAQGESVSSCGTYVVGQHRNQHGWCAGAGRSPQPVVELVRA
ncbi:MAG: hypothetical protein HY459_01810 [Parcubacteria group bacterium]|nr:hypothetical protein [Parcubacteria group bacterium]